MNWLVRLSARALEREEAEAVIGDLAECGPLGWEALGNIVGLVVRRQLLIWTAWRPWFGLVAVVGVSGFFLSRMLARLTIEVYEQWNAWHRFGVHYNTGVTSFQDDAIHMICLAAAIFCCTAVNASLLRHLMGRARWMIAVLWVAMTCECWTNFQWLQPGERGTSGHSPCFAFGSSLLGVFGETART